MTRLEAPRHYRGVAETDGVSLTNCSGLTYPARSVPYCIHNTDGCPFHYPGQYKGRHRTLPVTVGGYGMAPGATGGPLLSLIVDNSRPVVSEVPDTGPSHRYDRLDMLSLTPCTRPNKAACSDARCPVHCPNRYSSYAAKHKDER